VAATTIKHTDQGFVTVAGDRRSEVARTLAEPGPQALSLLDQFGLWGNLGVTPASWMSASILSFGMAAAVTVAVGPLSRRRRP
jgi:hypothetical protein